MKPYLLLLALLCTTFLFSQSKTQEKITISGKIIEADSNIPLEYATVSFTNAQGEIVNGGITNTKGKYAIKVPPGVYTVKYEFISYETKEIPNKQLTQDTTLPTVSLAINTEGLDEVVIRAETTEVQVRLDKKIYNIGKDLTTSGATVSDALNNVPSVNVDVEGAISLRGNDNVRILINGKPSAIAGFGSTDALRQLPAEAIEKVEVITSPSARYDAQGTAGILNIILKKEKTLGLNGSISTNIGHPTSSNVSGNINLRTDKFNIFNTTGVRYRDAPGNAYFNNQYFPTTFTDPETGEEVTTDPRFDRVIEDRLYERQDKGFNTNLGMEYFLTERSSITASGFLRLGDDEDLTTNNARKFSNGSLDETTVRKEREIEEDRTYQLSLNYENKFNDEGHKLTADFQYENDKEEERSFITENRILPSPLSFPSEDIVNNETQKEYLAQADYVLPIGENAQFEAGYRGTFENEVTDYILKQEQENGAFVRNDTLSNIFDYTENVNAVYTQYGNKFGKFSFLLGLRLENTQLKGEIQSNLDEDAFSETLGVDIDTDFDKNYLGLFPTVNLIYELAERENITLGYNRRINRPRGWFINPFPSRSSVTNVFQGNPDLDPAYASAFDLGYLKRWKKLTLTSSIYYQYETDSFERIQEQTGQVINGVNVVRTIPINLSTNERYGFELGLLYNPAKWLRLNGSFNYYNFKSDGSFNGIDYGTENNSWFARGSAKVSLPWKIDWQTNGFYRGPRNNAQTESDGIVFVSLAFSKDIMDDNGTIGLNVSDLLNSRKRNSLTVTDSFISESEFQWRERSVNLSFTYRFNQKKQRGRPDRSRDNGDEEGGFEG
ncbi:outer membrane beta-barrel family protein [Marixanthomonas spongiae]|uniref:TonB-dependent receptor n=1 Tax=Marixanthomonas spongiae TaxID=2174845 RepID=A0A2U0HYH5_9FLAO|nr:outer membrane beta-barrel family protein [Marixanthomonas spongiae]PVW13879.1 TonB-dependent receptor [Marixanthomonas spongiae]